jgi:hypothetical protein
MTQNETPEILLHIGTEKTGTTTLQKFLAENRTLLLKQRVLHPLCVAGSLHSKIAVYGDEGAQTTVLATHLHLHSPGEIEVMKKELERDIKEEIEKSNPKKIILSNEHCSSRFLEPKPLSVLKDFLETFSPAVKIVLYLRRQDEYFLSSYATAIKSGKTTELAIPEDMDNVNWVQSRYRYRGLIDRWAAVFGKENIILRVFDRSLLKGGDIITDFLHSTGIQEDSFTIPPPLNESVGADVLEFIRLLNQHLPAFENGAYNPTRATIVDILESLPITRKRSIEELDRFMRYFESENNQIAQEFLGRDELFASPFPEENYTTTPDISAERMMEIAAEVFKRWPDAASQSSNLGQKAVGKLKRLLG